MVITLNLTSDIYGPQDPKTGNQKLIKKNVCFKKTFETNSIQVQEFIDAKGNISKKYCTIYEGELGYKAVHKFEYVQKLISPLHIKGFKW